MYLSKEEVSILKAKIGLGEKMSVLDELKEKLVHSHLHDEILLLSSNINTIYSKRRTGQITLQDEMLAESSLGKALLEIIKITEKETNNKEGDTPKIKTKEEAVPQIKSTKPSDKIKNIIVLGGAGVGKSHFINEIFGKSIASTGDFVPTTLGIQIYELRSIGDNNISIVDTPGLWGDVEDPEYTKLIFDTLLEKIDLISVVAFVMSAYDHRLRSYDRKGIKTITDAFGKSIWSKTIIVLNYTDKIENKSKIYFNSLVSTRSKIIREALIPYANCEDIIRLPFVLTTMDKDEIDWTTFFWNEAESIVNNKKG